MLAHAPGCEERPNAFLRKQRADIATRPGNAGKGGPGVPRVDLGRGLLKNNRSDKLHTLAEDAAGPTTGEPWVDQTTSVVAQFPFPSRVASSAASLATVCGFTPRGADISLVALSTASTQGSDVCDRCLPWRRLSAAGLRLAMGVSDLTPRRCPEFIDADAGAAVASSDSEDASAFPRRTPRLLGLRGRRRTALRTKLGATRTSRARSLSFCGLRRRCGSERGVAPPHHWRSDGHHCPVPVWQKTTHEHWCSPSMPTWRRKLSLLRLAACERVKRHVALCVTGLPVSYVSCRLQQLATCDLNRHHQIHPMMAVV